MSNTATIERPDAPRRTSNANATANASSAATGTKGAAGCPKCGNPDPWGTASWCPQCGYYPVLGTCVTSIAEEGPAAGTSPEDLPPPSSHLEALARLPKWAYVLAAGVLVIFAVSVTVRVVTPDDSLARSLWSLAQLAIGGVTFISMHVYVFFKAGAKADRFSFFDLIIHPIDVWRSSFQELPATSRRIWTGTWGLMAALCAMLIIGGIRYSALTDDWGFKARPKKNLMKKITDQMIANAKEGDPGEEADDEAAKKKKEDEKKKKKSDIEMLSAECVIVGFNADRNTGEIKDLVLATIVDEKLQYAGTVTGNIPPEMQEQLRERLPKLTQDQPFVKCPVSALWVKPIVTCRTSFKSWSNNKRMQQPAVKELLADTDAK
jgi:ATP dependent DNA ligase C terminal region